jgi:hypothetical protein
MATFPHWLCHLKPLAGTLLPLLVDAFRDVGLCLGSPAPLAPGVGDRAATDLDPLASARVPTLLTLQIQTGTPAIAGGPAHAHPSYGPEEPNMRRGAHGQRMVAQAGAARDTSNGVQKKR